MVEQKVGVVLRLVAVLPQQQVVDVHLVLVMVCRVVLRRFRDWEGKWLIEEEQAVRCLKKDLFGCLHYFDFDKELWKSIRTTNILERAFREMRRRTRPMNNFFTYETSANRIMYGISNMLNQNWKDKTLKVISTN